VNGSPEQVTQINEIWSIPSSWRALTDYGWRQRASDKALTFVGTNPTGELITGEERIGRSAPLPVGTTMTA